MHAAAAGPGRGRPGFIAGVTALPVQPAEQAWWRHLGRAGVIAVALGAGEQLAARTGRPAPEERRVIHEHARRGGHQPVGTRPHAVEGGRRHQRGPGTPGHGDTEQSRQAPHLTLQIGQQVVIVHEHHAGPGPARPGVGQVQHDARQGVELGPRIHHRADPAQDPFPQRGPGRSRVEASRLPRELAHPLAVDVGTVVVERHRHVEGVPGDHDVGGPGVEGDPVERCVGLDHPAVILRVEPRVHLLLRGDEPVQPRGKLRQRRGQVRRLEDQQGADHLHPCRPALGPGADDDVTLAEPETGPPRAVLVRRPVADRHPGHPMRIAGGCRAGW